VLVNAMLSLLDHDGRFIIRFDSPKAVSVPARFSEASTACEGGQPLVQLLIGIPRCT
jgi:hypothetical protein